MPAYEVLLPVTPHLRDEALAIMAKAPSSTGDLVLTYKTVVSALYLIRTGCKPTSFFGEEDACAMFTFDCAADAVRFRLQYG